MYTPAQHAANWTLVTDAAPETPTPEQPSEPTPEPVDEWPAWKPWDGNNASLYPVGAKVTHNGKRWISTTPNNHYEPGVYGWTEQK